MARGSAPPLLQRMNERRVGDLLVRYRDIIEPRTGLGVARDFPSEVAAISAATEMQMVADFTGLIKVRAEGQRPNCQQELAGIAQKYGGLFCDQGYRHDEAIAACKRVAEEIEAAK